MDTLFQALAAVAPLAERHRRLLDGEAAFALRAHAAASDRKRVSLAEARVERKARKAVRS